MLITEKEKSGQRAQSNGTMKAVRIHTYGDSSVLKYEDAPIPSILPDGVLIRIHSAAVNPIDWKVREGHRKDKVQYELPLIPGWDVSGIIEQLGPLVKNFKAGDAVMARTDTARNGTYAEYVSARGYELALAPTHISLQEAAGIPLAAQTAWVGIFEKGNLKKDDMILIHGGSGGVGSFAVQFAKAAGAYVIATSSEKNLELVESLGADEVIDYANEDFSKRMKDVDIVFDTVGGEVQQKSFGVLRKGGALVSIVGVDEKAAEKAGVKATSFMMISNGSRLAEIAALVDGGMVRVVVAKEFPLSEARAAQDLSQSGHTRGKIILRVQE